MAILDPATILALAVQCSPVRVDPNLVLAIARVESGYDASRISAPNANGSRDYGLMQVNERNFSWLGLTPASALDPCQSIRAGVRVLTGLSAYNTGRPTAGIDNGYAPKVISAYRSAKDGAPIVSAFAVTSVREVSPPDPPCDAPRSDVWGQQACRDAAQMPHTGDNQ